MALGEAVRQAQAWAQKHNREVWVHVWGGGYDWVCGSNFANSRLQMPCLAEMVAVVTPHGWVFPARAEGFNYIAEV